MMGSDNIQTQLIKIREKYINIIKSELLGPGSEFNFPDKEHELISSSALSRYSVGIMYPKEVLEETDERNLDSEEENGIYYDEDNEEKTRDFKSFEPKDDLGVDDENENIEDTYENDLDGEINMSTQFAPSSMGMTFLVKGNPDEIICDISYATYRNAKMNDCIIPNIKDLPKSYEVPIELTSFLTYDGEKDCFMLKSGINSAEVRRIFEIDTLPEQEVPYLKNISYTLARCLSQGYVREPKTIKEYKIKFTESDYFESENINSTEDLKVKVVALKKRLKGDIYSVTLMLVNDTEDKKDGAKNKRCIYQSRIEVCTSNNKFHFLPSNIKVNFENLDEEEKQLELLYRNKKQFATGLGVSVDWNVNESGEGVVYTEYFPQREVPSTSFSLPENQIVSNDELSMKYLSDLDNTPKENKILSLRKMVDLYLGWIKELKVRSQELDPQFKSPAAKNILECEKAAQRMYAGLETLSKVDNAFSAFELANRSMFMQRIHIQKQNEFTKANADRYPDDEEVSNWLLDLDYKTESDNNAKWRPFQIAFLLMDINSIVYDNSEDRSLVDLIWFPTGGGKTEAYLGLTAFTIFYRKLTYPKEAAGTAVIMRYTLRLLAAQQFTRAATLICACEYIRQDCQLKKSKYKKYPLGKEEINIGLWIGGSHIPNRNTGNGSAKWHLDKLTENTKAVSIKNIKESHNKFQVLKCPWCGTKMVKDERNGKLVGDWGYSMSRNRFYMFCPHEDCDFTKKLPIQIIDEELYANPPTLLFGTVDKFAMMSWDGSVGKFFGMGTPNRSPELIIQDELHLISGALGTMVGLYETAVDGISSMKGVKPKVIASTATIRRAKEQCSALYNRDVVQFPPPGLDAEDSFFSRENPIDHDRGIYGRSYIGIMPSGKTKVLTEAKAMATMLQKTYTLNLEDNVKDKLWTLTAYYNSLKDLGKASTLVVDDVKRLINTTASRFYDPRRIIIGADELTSRVSTTELNETLDKLEKIEYSKANVENKIYASNVLLATNMISVGIDVARLNVMLMLGQPKLTSEYIQASSRVGRSYPGMAFIQYDSTKSRDRSHYERFRTYHDSFYKLVEPTGATPFSKPARERGLHAVLAAMIRQKLSLIEDKDAGLFDKDKFKTELEDIKKYILNRVDEINKRNLFGSGDDLTEIENEIDNFVDFWQDMVNNCEDEGKSLLFGKKNMITPLKEGEERLLKQFNTAIKDNAKETLTSMRNVDTAVSGSIIIWGNENDSSN